MSFPVACADALDPVSRVTMSEASRLLEVDGIAHSFGGLKVLTNLTLPVLDGKITGLIGPNGSGKTTCFNIITGFLQPDGGRVRFMGQDVTGFSIQERARAGMTRTFQAPKVFERMTVLENVMVGAYKSTTTGIVGSMLRTRAARRELGRMREAASAVCEKFGLTKHRNVLSGKLPAGQRRIVELARAYMTSPRLLLLDEPSSGLNSEEIEALRSWITALNRDGLTIVLVSHDMGLMTVSDTVHALYFGEIIASGSMESVEADPRVREAYLGV